MLFAAGLLLATLPAVLGGCCPNACSGHGSCGSSSSIAGIDECTCFPNWQSGEAAAEAGDCSDRSCPYEVAWADAPALDGSHHYYAECANKGSCDRETGECKCYDGYEGKACARMSCPDDCSGHGRCRIADELGHGINAGATPGVIGSSNGNDAKTWPYYNWDQSRSRLCQCDAGYEGLNCALRSCPHGSDIMAAYQVDHVQRVHLLFTAALNAAGGDGGHTFALTFTSKTGTRYTTGPLALTSGSLQSAVKIELEKLPGNVIDGVTVVLTAFAVSATSVDFTVKFDGQNVQGAQNLLEVEYKPCTDNGCTPMLTGLSTLDLVTTGVTATAVTTDNASVTAADTPNVSVTCGGRGKCKYSTGECECFSGYYGAHCEGQTSLI
jgi:EGF-like domain